MNSSINRTFEYLNGLLREFIALPNETECVEFKQNNTDPEQIGEYISALSNSAALSGKANAYLVWGVDDATHAIVGTNFSPSAEKKGNEELESWLLRLLSPKLHFHFYSLDIDEKKWLFWKLQERHIIRFNFKEKNLFAWVPIKSN